MAQRSTLNEAPFLYSPAMNTCRRSARVVVKYCLPAHDDALLHVVNTIDKYLTPADDNFTTACEGGAQERTLGFLLAKTTPKWKDAVRGAVRGGHLHVLKWMSERQDDRGPWKLDYDEALEVAASHGHLNVVKWLYARGMDWHTLWELDENAPGNIEKPWSYQHCLLGALTLAAEHGHFEVVQWIFKVSADECIHNTSAMARAVANGHLPLAQWLYHVRVDAGNQYCRSRGMDRAAANGHLEVLQWLHTNGIWECTAPTMDSAATEGRLEVVKWLHQIQKWSSNALFFATSNGHVEVAKWIYENTPGRYHDNMQWAAGNAAEKGKFDVLEWLHQHFPTTFSEHIMRRAVQYGRFDIVKWLHDNRSEGCTNLAPCLAAKSGNMDLVQWFHEHYPDKFGPEVMDEAAENGHLDMVQWLHENRPEGCTKSAMDLSAEYGHLDVVLYLLEHRSEGFSSKAMTVPQDVEVECLFGTSGSLHPNSRMNPVTSEQLNVLRVAFKSRPAFVQGCLRCLAEIAIRMRYIAILDWTNQFGLKLRSNVPLRYAVSQGDVNLLQWFYRNGFMVDDPDLLELAVAKNRLKATRWLSQRGYQITLSLVEVAGRNRHVRLMRWLIEHGPPLTLSVTKTLVFEYGHVEVAPWVSEADRVQLVLEALRKGDKELIWWLFMRTCFEDESSQRSIRDGIQFIPTAKVG